MTEKTKAELSDWHIDIGIKEQNRREANTAHSKR